MESGVKRNFRVPLGIHYGFGGHLHADGSERFLLGTSNHLSLLF